MPTKSLNYIIGKKNIKNYEQTFIPYYKAVKYINDLNLDKEKIIIVGDYKVAYIKNNHKIIQYIDPYFCITGNLINQGDDFFYKILKDNSIKYVITSRLYENYYLLLAKRNISMHDYLSQYKNKVPSLYSDAQKLQNFLENYAQFVCGDNHYKIYKLN